MSSILLIGLLGMFLVISFKEPITNLIGNNNKMIHKLNSAKWFQNHWLSGMFLFVMNAVLFFSTGFLLYVLTSHLIAYVHLLVMFLAVICSLFLWGVMKKAWHGTKNNRLKMGAIGSSFYIILSLIIIYLLVTLEPAFPGEDTFMRAIGLVFTLIVTTVAWVTCFIFTGISKK